MPVVGDFNLGDHRPPAPGRKLQISRVHRILTTYNTKEGSSLLPAFSTTDSSGKAAVVPVSGPFLWNSEDFRRYRGESAEENVHIACL